jgi:hypothetical protein
MTNVTDQACRRPGTGSLLERVHYTLGKIKPSKKTAGFEKKI